MTVTLNTSEIEEAVNDYVEKHFGDREYGQAVLFMRLHPRDEWAGAGDDYIQAVVKIFTIHDQPASEDEPEA